jgi:hypothetical protein
MSKSKKNEVIIALIGLVTAVAAGVLTNWDKLFNQEMRVIYTYRPIGDFDTELRRFFDVSGTRN